ncbi:anti-sigma factor family protein [Herpetosiphon sp. NSE202]|uniref:anti-sigma factor family protein n=1 Tax=Herpetosiphon sp. NSE202 TaxID=3351349 RepID=UPI0036337606
MTPISEQHQELLSAALDGQLSAAEQAQLDQQLEHDPGLAVEFAELRSMQALLQDLPPVRPPRSFTLDPALHAPKRSLWLSGWTRWVTVVGVFALMLTVGLQLTNQAEQSMTMAPESRIISTESAAVQSQQNENENPAATSMSTARSAAMPTPEMALLQQPTGGAADAMLGAYPPPAQPYAAGSGPMSDTSDMARSISPEQATAMAGNPLNEPLIEPNGTSSPDTISLEPPVLKDQVLEQAAPAPAESESSLLLWFSIALVLGVGLAFAMGYWFKLHKQA